MHQNLFVSSLTSKFEHMMVVLEHFNIIEKLNKEKWEFHVINEF